ncbi:MAG: hypothetical protein JO257_36400 [Deltaproteobacteria bacterium]|nr:hypothetical protein [Deltaproteobacteria bacterium]
MMKGAIVAIAVLGLGACGKSPPAAGGVDAPGTTGDSAAPFDGPNAEGWTPLISRGWDLAGGATNTYKCTRIKVTNDMWVAGFRAQSPTGTHHSVLTISTSNTQTGDYDCSAGSLDNQMLYAAGVGTDDLNFPAGVAMHIPAGTYINLNLHLFNATDNMISGTSGVLVKVMKQSDVVHEADMMFSGTFLVSIPSDGQPHVMHGSCPVHADEHIFTLWPHMHQTATHQKWTYTEGSTTTTLLDDDYMFAEQKNYPIADTLLKAGDTIDTYCTYVNNTGTTINFGDGSDKEMCFTGMYKYPAGGNLFACAMGQ